MPYASTCVQMQYAGSAGSAYQATKQLIFQTKLQLATAECLPFTTYAICGAQVASLLRMLAMPIDIVSSLKTYQAFGPSQEEPMVSLCSGLLLFLSS